MSNLTRSSIKAKAATATASKAIKTVMKACLSKQKKSTRMRLNSLNTAFVDLTWVTDVHAFTFVFLRSRLFSAKGRRRLFYCIITTMERKFCRMFFIRRLPRKRQPFWFSRALSDIMYRSVSLVFDHFKQYNVNKRETKQLRISTQLREKCTWCLKAKRYN